MIVQSRCAPFLLAGFLSVPCLVVADPVSIKLSAGAVYQESNEVQIPNHDEGTRYSLEAIAGSGPWTALRLESLWDLGERHGLRLLLAPLTYRETGNIDEPVSFAGGVFPTDQEVDAEYRFNSWRVCYRYQVRAGSALDLWLGASDYRQRSCPPFPCPPFPSAGRVKTAPHWFGRARFLTVSASLGNSPGRSAQ